LIDLGAYLDTARLLLEAKSNVSGQHGHRLLEVLLLAIFYTERERSVVCLWRTYNHINVLLLIPDLVKVLLKYGADVTPNDHLTVLDFAFQMAYSDEKSKRNHLEIPGRFIEMLNSMLYG